MAKYKGDNRVSRIRPPKPHLGYYLEVRVGRTDIHFFNKIMEGYSHLALVVTVDPVAGIMAVHTTPEAWEQLLEVLQFFPRPLEIIRDCPENDHS